MAKIFISYRREDSIASAGRINDHLELRFGDEDVFLDTQDIQPGVQWQDYLSDSIADVDVMLVIIGPNWTRIMAERAHEEDDFVRFEVEQALTSDHITIIPVLLDNTPMPLSSNLPPSIRDLTRWNATRVRAGQDFRNDIATLEAAIEAATKLKARPARHVARGSAAAAAAEPRRNNGALWGVIALVVLLAVMGGIAYIAMPDLFGAGSADDPTAEVVVTNTEPATDQPAAQASEQAVDEPTAAPTDEPTPAPTDEPTPTPTEEPVVTPTTMPCTVTTTASSARVRIDPDVNSDQLSFLREGETGRVLAQTAPNSPTGLWYRVEIERIAVPGWVNVVGVEVSGACDDIPVINN